MSTPIQAVPARIEIPATREHPTPVGSQSSGDFGDHLASALKSVDAELRGADQSARAFLQGNVGIHELAIDLEKADLSLRMLTRVRNRVLEAYKEISRMNI
jgi:flagellar hook-basal body complex protein FliE